MGMVGDLGELLLIEAAEQRTLAQVAGDIGDGVMGVGHVKRLSSRMDVRLA